MADANDTDFWPSFDDVEQTRTPVATIRELAGALAPKTNNLVEAVVRPYEGSKKDSGYSLLLSAPILRYTYGLLNVEYGIEFWPLKLKSSAIGDGNWLSIENEFELRTRLAEAFRHPTTVKIIRAMISQSRDQGLQQVAAKSS